MRRIACLLVGVFFMGIGAALADAVLLDQPFASPDALKGVYVPKATDQKGIAVVAVDGGMALRVHAVERQKVMTCKLPIANTAGRRIMVTAEVKGNNVARAKDVWNGAKFMLEIRHADGKSDWPGAKVKNGTFGWEKISLIADIANDDAAVNIILGFQDSCGEYWVRNLKVTETATFADMRTVVNMGYKDEKANDGKGGWSDQGAENDAARFKWNQNNFIGIPFSLLNPAANGGKSVLTMRSSHFPSGPMEATAPLAGQAGENHLYLLHTLCYGSRKVVGTVTVNGPEGRNKIFTITGGVDVGDWWNPSKLSNAFPAATWSNASTGTLGVYCSKFLIPADVCPVRDIKISTVGGESTWVVLGATLTAKDYSFPNAKKLVMTANEKWKPLPEFTYRVIEGSALDRSHGRPAEPVKDRVIINKQGHLALSGSPDTPVRFLSVTDSFFRLDKKYAEDFAKQLRLQGYNMARMHFLDAYLMAGFKKGRVWREPADFDPEHLDRFDYLVYCLTQNGIYLNVDCMTNSVGYQTGGQDWLKELPQLKVKNFKFKLFFDPWVRANWRQGVEKLLTHVNPYTRKRLIDEPALVCMVGCNEQEFAFFPNFMKAEDAPLMLPAWRKFLRKRYNNDIAACRKVWGGDAADFDAVALFPLAGINWRDAKGADIAAFIYDTKKELDDWYQAQLRELGFKGIFSQHDMGTSMQEIVLRHDLPVIMMHNYFAHPNMATKTIDQTSCLGGGNRLFRSINATCEDGKPMLLTEWGVPWWNRFRYEQAFAISAYAAMQGYDLLNVHGSPVPLVREAMFPFRVGADPVGVAAEFLTHYLFNRGGVKTAPVAVNLVINSRKVREKFLYNDAISGLQAGFGMVTGCRTTVDPVKTRDNVLALPVDGGEIVLAHTGFIHALDAGSGLIDTGKIVKELKSRKVLDAGNRTDFDNEVFESSTGELFLDVRKAFMTVNTPRVQGVCAKAGNKAQLNDFAVDDMSVNGNLCVVSVDDHPLKESRRMVLVFATNAVNTDMAFTDTDMRSCTTYGKPPALIETGKFAFSLANADAGSLKMYALNNDGKRLAEIPLRNAAGRISAAVDTAALPAGPSIFYEITVRK